MSEPTYTNVVRQEIKFYRVLLLNAALSALFEQHITKGEHLPSVRELSEEIRDYWRGLADDAGNAGAFGDMGSDSIERLLTDLALDLPQYR